MNIYLFISVLTDIQNISYHWSNWYNLWYGIDFLEMHPDIVRAVEHRRSMTPENNIMYLSLYHMPAKQYLG